MIYIEPELLDKVNTWLTPAFDKQTQDHIKNLIATNPKELKESLEQGKKIVITTIQKFPFIVDGIADLSDNRFAVVIDEAHSSQSGTAAGKMNQAMGGGADPDEPAAGHPGTRLGVQKWPNPVNNKKN